MYNREIRDYEVSIWTLQDSFIAVLKASKLENKGHIQDPKMVIKDDGTREFSFSLPMYLYDGPDKKENPIWYTVRNGNLLVNMRKIKVIFNKMTKNEEVFEFIITKVTENHENDELTCDVECEGLAFHELGKIGYKISLDQDDFLNEYKDWADGKIDGEEPRATLNYWCDKVLKNSKWIYCVRMDWAAYDGLIPIRYIGGNDDEPRFKNLGWGLVDRNAYLASSEEENNLEEAELATKQELSNSSNFELLDYFSLTDDDFIILNAYKKERNFRLIDKIYEDEYVSSWNVDSNSNVLTPASVEKFREKERIIDVKESNIYNITQTIAETFGVFCRYEYEYDDDYHIIGRRIIFYNNFIQEATGTIDLNYSGNESSKFTGAVDLSYPYNTSHIEREMDGTDIITKMFVKNLSDNASDSGLATIMDTDANKSGENYLLNFDYMYSIGTISQEQYDAIPKFEKQVKEINNRLVPLSNHITYLKNELNDVKADKTIAENSIALDNERLESVKQAMKAITQDANSNPDPNNPGAIMVTENRPDYCYLIIDRGINGRYIKLTYTGVLRDTLKLYEKYDRMGTTGEKLSKQLKSGYEVEEDEYGNITRIIINATLEDNNNTLYATYSYKPDLYYENIKKLWNKRLKDDQEKLDKAKSRIEELEGTEETEGQIEKLRNDYNDLITQKENLIARFERMMGPALREGNWQPEDDYANYGDKKTVVQRLDLNSVFNDDVEISIGWDGEDKLFDGEDKSYELIGADTIREYYPFINLENNFDVLRGKEELKQYSFCFYDKDLGDIDDPAYYKYFAIGSRSRLGFLKINDKVKPVLFLSDTDSLPAKEKILNPFIGKITVKETEGQNGFEYQEERLMDVINIDYSQNEIVYPRIQICSSQLKVSEDQLSIYFGNKLLKNYEDYYINSRTNDDTYLTTYYITIKPEFLFKNGFGDFTIHYAISNTGLIMYLDAIQVLKENAYPQVSYTIDPSLVNKTFTNLAYKTLNKIVHINDYELKFENILGYISELELDLDHPWEDSITITNYKTKFEDLFSSIVAQTEDMKKNSYIIGMAASAFTDYGTLSSEFMQNSINKPDLSYAFNNGKLTIDNENGIWGISDDGVVAMRGGGIFTANEQDGDGNWIWNTGILPSGINASLITTGQLDTNLIRIFAGDDLRFQMNGDGIFAYKDDAKVDDDHPDAKYYARYYSEGLFLHVDDGVKVADNTYVKTKDGKGIDRVELSWNGLILRDWNNEKTLSTDPDTGDLTVKGNIQATSLTIIGNGENINVSDYVDNKIGVNNEIISQNINDRINNNNTEIYSYIGDIQQELQEQVDKEIDTWFFKGPPFYHSNNKELPQNGKNFMIGNRFSEDLEEALGIEWENNKYTDDSVIIIKRHTGDIYYDIAEPSNQTPADDNDFYVEYEVENDDDYTNIVKKSTTYGQAWRLIVIEENNIITYNWLSIADTTTTAALKAVVDAQTTADSKIATYIGSVDPSSAGIEGASKGDLYINSNDENKIYRYNENKQWILVQNNNKLVNFDLADDASILSVIENNPYNFDTHKPSISLNTNNGLLIKGEATTSTITNGTEKSYPFFQVTSKGMGFFKYNQSIIDGVKKDSISNLLYYNEGNLIVTGTIQASSGWLGGDNGWIIGENKIFSKQNNFYLFTEFGSLYKVPSIVIKAINRQDIVDENIEQRLIINQNEISLNDFLKETSIDSNEALSNTGNIYFNFLEGTGRLKQIFADNIIKYSTNKLIKYMYKRDINGNTEKILIDNIEYPILETSLEDFINLLASFYYEEAEFIINDISDQYVINIIENNQNNYQIVKFNTLSTIIFSNVITPVIKITGTVEQINNNGIISVNFSKCPSIQIKNCSGAFYLQNLLWEGLYEYSVPEETGTETQTETETNTFDYNNINSYGVFINNCNAFVSLNDCWINTSVCGIINSGGRMVWNNSYGSDCFSEGYCQQYFGLVTKGGYLSIEGSLPNSSHTNSESDDILEKTGIETVEGGFIIAQGWLSSSTAAMDDNIVDITQKAHMDINCTCSGFVGGSSNDLIKLTIEEGKNARQFIELILTNYQTKTNINISYNKIVSAHPIYNIVIDNCEFKSTRGSYGGNTDPRPRTLVTLPRGGSDFIHDVAGSYGGNASSYPTDNFKRMMMSIVKYLSEENPDIPYALDDGAIRGYTGDGPIAGGKWSDKVGSTWWNRCSYAGASINIDYHFEKIIYV